MKVGCFALIDPFSTLEHQLERIASMGFKLLLEPHGPLTDLSKGLHAIMSPVNHPQPVIMSEPPHTQTRTFFRHLAVQGHVVIDANFYPLEHSRASLF